MRLCAWCGHSSWAATDAMSRLSHARTSRSSGRTPKLASRRSSPLASAATAFKQHATACGLAVVYVLVAIYSFTSWAFGFVNGDNDLSRTVFFLDFFTWLIVSDIIILLSSYKHITDFLQLARNTGFVLSTVIIRVGIGTPGYTGAALFTLSALLATAVLRLSILDY